MSAISMMRNMQQAKIGSTMKMKLKPADISQDERHHYQLSDCPSTNMAYFTHVVTLCLLLLRLVNCWPVSAEQGYRNARIHTVYQFPNDTWIENIAVRRNGNLLITLITSPEVWEVDPTKRTAHFVHRFPYVTSGWGITEIEPDVFAISTGNYSITTFLPTPGTYSVWKIDFQSRQPANKYNLKLPLVTKITDIPSAHNLNGVTLLPNQPHSIVLGDSYGGRIYRLDTRTGAYTVWADDPLFKGNTSALVPLGINGLKAHGNALYFTNSFGTPLLGRVRVSASGAAVLPAEILVAKPAYPLFRGAQADDIAVDDNGDVWLTTDPTNTLVRVDPRTRKQTVVAGGVDQTVLAGDTAAAFGRTPRDRKTLYITTNGGLAGLPADEIVGGKVVALDTRR